MTKSRKKAEPIETEEPGTFVLLTNRSGAYVLRLDDRIGFEAKAASQAETLRAMRIGVACLNTGKTEKEIYQAIEGLTP